MAGLYYISCIHGCYGQEISLGDDQLSVNSVLLPNGITFLKFFVLDELMMNEKDEWIKKCLHSMPSLSVIVLDHKIILIPCHWIHYSFHSLFIPWSLLTTIMYLNITAMSLCIYFFKKSLISWFLIHSKLSQGAFKVPLFPDPFSSHSFMLFSLGGFIGTPLLLF